MYVNPTTCAIFSAHDFSSNFAGGSKKPIDTSELIRKINWNKYELEIEWEIR